MVSFRSICPRVLAFIYVRHVDRREEKENEKEKGKEKEVEEEEEVQGYMSGVSSRRILVVGVVVDDDAGGGHVCAGGRRSRAVPSLYPFSNDFGERPPPPPLV